MPIRVKMQPKFFYRVKKNFFNVDNQPNVIAQKIIKNLSDYVNSNQKRFLQAMKASQFKNLQQLRNARGR